MRPGSRATDAPIYDHYSRRINLTHDPARQPVKTATPAHPVSENASIAPAAASTPMVSTKSTEHAIEAIRQHMKAGLKMTVIAYRLDRAGIQPPNGHRHWRTSDVVQVMLRARLKRHPPQQPLARSAAE